MTATTIKKQTTTERVAGLEATLAEILALLSPEPAAKTTKRATSKATEKVTTATSGHTAEVGTPAAIKACNLANADFLRELKVVPTGTAWTLLKNGERNPKVLRAANKADGEDWAKYSALRTKITTPAKKVAAKVTAKKAPAAKTTTAKRLTKAQRTAKVQTLVDAGFTQDEAIKAVATL